MKPVTLYRPASIEEAVEILAHHGPEAAVYAGGTDLLVRLKNRLATAPKSRTLWRRRTRAGSSTAT